MGIPTVGSISAQTLFTTVHTVLLWPAAHSQFSQSIYTLSGKVQGWNPLELSHPIWGDLKGLVTHPCLLDPSIEVCAVWGLDIQPASSLFEPRLSKLCGWLFVCLFFNPNLARVYFCCSPPSKCDSCVHVKQEQRESAFRGDRTVGSQSSARPCFPHVLRANHHGSIMS